MTKQVDINVVCASIPIGWHFIESRRRCGRSSCVEFRFFFSLFQMRFFLEV